MTSGMMRLVRSMVSDPPMGNPYRIGDPYRTLVRLSNGRQTIQFNRTTFSKRIRISA